MKRIKCLACNESPIINIADYDVNSDEQVIECPSCGLPLATKYEDLLTGQLSWKAGCLNELNEDGKIIKLRKVQK